MQLFQHININTFFHSDNKEKHVCCTRNKADSSLCSSFPLALANEQEIVEIVSLQSCCRMERLLSMGLRLGDEIEIIKRQHGGAMLIEKAGNRFALGGGMALKIHVNRKKDGKNIG